MQPESQVEIQLGHMCHHRRVFNVRGQKTELREGFSLPTEPILSQVEVVYARGNRNITLRGGEPTWQPGFVAVVQRGVGLGDMMNAQRRR